MFDYGAKYRLFIEFMNVFGFGKFLAPESEETDEEYVNCRINSFLDGKNELEAINDLSLYAKLFPNQIGEKAGPSLIQALKKYITNNDTVTDILTILNTIIKGDSNTSAKNAEMILNENESLQIISNCLKSQKAAIRAQALSIITRLITLNIKKVQDIFLYDNNFQTNLLHLENDQNEAIRTSFMNLIPELVKDNEVVQQNCAFYLMDNLIEQIKFGNWKLINIFNSLLENNTATQKMFVEMNHLSIFVKPIENGNEQAINFLTMLFTSSDSFNFRKSLPNSGLLQPVISLAIGNNEKKNQYIKLLGLFIKGNSELCAKLTENSSDVLEIILNYAISSKDEEERKSAIFFLECYLSKSKITPNLLAKAICVEKYISLMKSYDSKVIEVDSLLNIACSCILAKHETLTIFFDSKESFISNAMNILMTISDINSIELISILKFACAAIWESTNTASFIINYLANHSREHSSGVVFLLKLCSQDKSPQIRKISSLFILECLIFKDLQEIGFNELISTLQTGQIKLTQLLSCIKEYTYDLQDDQSLWSEFAQELIHLIKKNSEVLLTNQVIQSESVQIASLKNMVNKLTNDNKELADKNENLQKESTEKDTEIERLQKENEDMSSVMEVYEKHLSQQQNNESGTNKENELLQQIEEMKNQIKNLQSSNNEEDVNILHEEYENQLKLQKELQNQLNLAQQIADENKESLEKTENELVEAYNTIDEINAKIEKKKKKIQVLKESLKSNDSNTINTKYNEQIQLYQELNQKFEETKKIADENKESLEKTENELVEANNEIDKINKTLEQKKEKIKKLKDEIQKKSNPESNQKENDEKIKNLIEENDRKQMSLSKMQDELNGIKEKFNNQISQINELKNLIQEKNNEIQNIKSETQKEITCLKNKIEEYESQNIEIQKNVDEREKVIKNLSNKVEALEKVSKEKDIQIEELNKQLSEKEKTQETQINEKVQYIDQLNSKFDEIKMKQNKKDEQKENEIQELSKKIEEQINLIKEYENNIQETKKANLVLTEQK